MDIKIQISDELYRTLVVSGKRMRGSIALVSPNEGNFNAFASHADQRKVKQFIKLPHGRASIDEEHVRVHLCINRQECDVKPAYVIYEEGEQAGDFVFKQIGK